MVSNVPAAPTLDDIRKARDLLAPFIIQTPLVRLNVDGVPGEIFLKLENLQPVGAFKSRCMGNAVLTMDKDALRRGVYTASSGNAGLGLAWIASKLGVAATVYSPESAPESKLDAIRRFGARIHPLSENDWWEMIRNSGHPDGPGMYVDAVRDPAAMAGNGTIGLEIIEQLPDVEAVVVPFGGGGLTCGIASAIRAIKPDTRMIVAESSAAMPLGAAFTAGEPLIAIVERSFISGAGAPSVLDEMWPLLRELVDDTVVSPVTEVADAVKVLFEHNHVVAEGAGAIAVAGALGNSVCTGKTVCVVSGGNIGCDVMAAILQGQPV